MVLSKRSIETLIDLVEIKLSCIDGIDRENRDVSKMLTVARNELQAMIAAPAAPKARPVELPIDLPADQASVSTLRGVTSPTAEGIMH